MNPPLSVIYAFECTSIWCRLAKINKNKPSSGTPKASSLTSDFSSIPTYHIEIHSINFHHLRRASVLWVNVLQYGISNNTPNWTGKTVVQSAIHARSLQQPLCYCVVSVRDSESRCTHWCQSHIWLTNNWYYHIEVHSTGIEPANIDPLRGNAMSTTQRDLRLECTSIWLLISVVKPPTAYNCFPISRQSAPVVRQRSSSAQFSRIGDPWERTVWPKPAIPQATKILARCLTRLSTGQPRLYGDFSVTCLTCRYLMYLVKEVGIEPTRPEATGLQPARTPLFHFLQNFYWGDYWVPTSG